MRGLKEFPEEYFDRFSTDPVQIRPFDPRARKVALDYLKRLERVLGLGIELAPRGSTRFGIAGKGDIELGVYPTDEEWVKVLERLRNEYGEAGKTEANYARFNDVYEGYEIEVIVLRGYEAQVDRKLTEYLAGDAELLEEYERVKRKYAYSKREYEREKDRFLRRVVVAIPEG